MWACVSLSLSLSPSLPPCLQEPSSTSTCVIARKMVTHLQTSRAYSSTMWGARGILGSLNSSQCSGLEPQVWNNFGFSKSPRDLESNSCGPTPLTVANKTQRLGTTKIETFSSLQDQKMWGEKGAVEDGGMTISGAITAMQTHGACMEKDWPFTLEHVNKKPTDECFADASKYKVRKCAKIVALQPSLVGFCVGVR